MSSWSINSLFFPHLGNCVGPGKLWFFSTSDFFTKQNAHALRRQKNTKIFGMGLKFDPSHGFLAPKADLSSPPLVKHPHVSIIFFPQTYTIIYIKIQFNPMTFVGVITSPCLAAWPHHRWETHHVSSIFWGSWRGEDPTGGKRYGHTGVAQLGMFDPWAIKDG